MSPDRLLVSSIGISDYTTTSYQYETEQGIEACDTRFSPVALAAIHDIDAAYVFRTKEAGDKHDDALESDFGEINVEYTPVEIELIASQEDVDDILYTIVETFREREGERESVVLDISHSFRSLPIVFFFALMHLDALGDISLDGIYYSEFAGRDDHDQSTIIDLTYLHTLMEWYHAFQTAETTGTLRPVRTMIEEKRGELFKAEHEPTEFAAATNAINGAQQYLDSGLPIEAGLATQNALSALEDVDRSEFIGPEGLVLSPLKRLLRGFEATQDVSDKSDLQLDMDELQREATVVEFYRVHDRYWIALACARELFINRLLYEQGITDDWLSREKRKEITPDPYEERDSDSPVVQLWEQLGKRRNMYAHAGFKDQGTPSKEEINTVISSVCDRIDDDEFWSDYE